MILIGSDWHDVDAEIDRIQNMPNRKTVRLLNGVLDRGFAMTQADVHEETSSLKSSGQKDSSLDRFIKKWEGRISYGGPSAGVNNPVDYAIYEAARGVGGAGGGSDAKGDHNFMRRLDLLDPDYIQALLKGLSKP